jgi:hypothetical protein
MLFSVVVMPVSESCEVISTCALVRDKARWKLTV